MLKKTIKILFILLLLFGIERFCYLKTAGFRLKKITSHLPYNSEWKVDQPFPEELIDTTYTFLGSGVQCYAFENKDKTTVLKVFKHYHSFPSNDGLEKISFPPFLNHYKESCLRKRYDRLYSIFNSCTLAYQKLQEETALIYLHLNPTNTFRKQITLIDKIGNRHLLNLDTTPFLLQKKGVLIFDQLHSFLKNQKLEEAKQLIYSLVQLIEDRTAKGIINTDPKIYRNFAYLDGRAIEIDTGSFSKRFFENEIKKREAVHFQLLELEVWLKKNATLLLPFLHQKLKESVASPLLPDKIFLQKIRDH